MSGAIPPLSIKILAKGPGYKSIRSLEWIDVPGFAIVTGRNGSGKTQLLELIAYHLTGTRPPPNQAPMGVVISIEGVAIGADEVAFVPSTGRFSEGSAASLAHLQSLRQSLYQQTRNIQNYAHDPIQMTKAKRIEKLIGGRNWEAETKNGQTSLDEDEFSALLVDVDVVAILSTIFVAHRVKMVEALERDTPGFDKNGNALGPSPWDVVNEALIVADFPYRVVDPTSVGLLDQYELKLKEKTTGVEIRPGELSSGERVLLQLILWLFSSSKDGAFPKLLLLDEPDAHLHPSMTVQFLTVISEVLVRKHGVRVIMTTHSPSTVALAPEDAIFQMERGEAEIKKITDKSTIIAVLTAGLITVSPATRFCFVEDEDDVNFYNMIRDLLTDNGPSRDSYSIKSSPSLVFIAASIGKGASKTSGGKNNVEKWVNKLDADPLVSTFLGVIDQDENNQASSRIRIIGRYSFENYLLDPVNIFALLLEHGSAPKLARALISVGDEHQIRSLPSAQLQEITDAISAQIKLQKPELDAQSSVAISYTNGTKIAVPEWFVKSRGHDLLKTVQDTWGGPHIVTPPKLILTMRRVRLIPIELAQLFSSLQT